MAYLTGKEVDEVEMMLKLMEYDNLTDWEDNFVASVSEQFEQRGDLTERQYDKLREVFKLAAGRDRTW